MPDTRNPKEDDVAREARDRAQAVIDAEIAAVETFPAPKLTEQQVQEKAKAVWAAISAKRRTARQTGAHGKELAETAQRHEPALRR